MENCLLIDALLFNSLTPKLFERIEMMMVAEHSHELQQTHCHMARKRPRATNLHEKEKNGVAMLCPFE